MTQHVPPPPPPQQQYPQNPKAAAKAAKAYAKSLRPWYKKKRFILPIGLIALIVIISVATSGSESSGNDDAKSDKGSSQNKTSPAKNSGEKSKGKSSAYGSSKLPLQNGDWRLDSINVKNDGLGSLTATGRITYTGDDQRGGNNLFTVSIFKGKKHVGTLNGGANTVKPGRTVTVEFLSTDKYIGGPYKYDFQNDL